MASLDGLSNLGGNLSFLGGLIDFGLLRLLPLLSTLKEDRQDASGKGSDSDHPFPYFGPQYSEHDRSLRLDASQG
jgi:hypothetical protein